MDSKDYLLTKQIWLADKMLDMIQKSTNKYQTRFFYNETSHHFINEYQDMYLMIDEVREIARLLNGNKPDK